MAATISINHTIPVSQGWEVIHGTFALDSSYPTGGEALDPSNIARVERLFANPGASAAQGFGYLFNWDAANQKVAVGYIDNNNASDGPFIEVPATTDLSAITNVPFVAWVQY
jgi:hypothetical protein